MNISLKDGFNYIPDFNGNKDVKKKTITVDNDKDITGDHEYTIQIKDSGGVVHDSSVKLSPPTGDKPVIRN